MESDYCTVVDGGPEQFSDHEEGAMILYSRYEDFE